MLGLKAKLWFPGCRFQATLLGGSNKIGGHMRNALIVLFLVSCADSASAQNCNLNGGSVFCDNGLSGTRSGNTTFWNDGTSSIHSGNSTFNSDGTSAIHSGSNTFFSDGTSAIRSGNTTFFSDGRSCTRSGNSVFCN